MSENSARITVKRLEKSASRFYVQVTQTNTCDVTTVKEETKQEKNETAISLAGLCAGGAEKVRSACSLCKEKTLALLEICSPTIKYSALLLGVFILTLGLFQNGTGYKASAKENLMLSQNVAEEKIKVEDLQAAETLAKQANLQALQAAESVAEATASTESGNMMMPTNGTLTSTFGTRWGRAHEGIDFGGNTGAHIYAADGGRVTYSQFHDGGYGYMIKIDHGNGTETCYAHCNSLLVPEGAVVEKGDVIATLGNTGRSTGPHLHFEVLKNGTPVDPLSYLQQLA